MSFNRNTIVVLGIIAIVVIVGMYLGVVTEGNIGDLFRILRGQ